MNSFLSQVVSDVLLKKKEDLQNVVFVLPSQRACVFLKDELIKQLDSVTFLPKLISIENFIQELAGVQQIDMIRLLFDFYSIYKSNTPKEEIDSFERFSQWATIVIQDFNEVDRHLVNTKDLFYYLRDINRLNNWSPTTELSKNYFAFFEKLNLYYDKFYTYLLSEKIGYQGLIYREAEANIQNFIASNKNTHIVLAGFNALNKAEENIFQCLLENEIASIYWDADERYLNDKNNATGTFMRKYKSNWTYFEKNEFNWLHKSLDSEKYIEVIGASKNVSQIKYVSKILSNQDSFKNTALVLSDESLLNLTLSSLPKSVDKINITMGYPLKDVPIADFFIQIFQLYINQQRLNLVDKHLFYFKNILTVCNHPYLKKIIGQNEYSVTELLGKSNQIFLSKEAIAKLFMLLDKSTFEKFSFLFEANVSVNKMIENSIQLLLNLKDCTDGIEKEYVFKFYTVFQQLKTLNEAYGHITTIATLYDLFIQLMANESLSFEGEPLEGLQLMGVLETRLIDFDTVILTSVNEGVLPSSKSDQSFIPFDVKKQFGLPTYQEKDAIFSYHFYRLLHRAKNIYLLYNTEADMFGAGEKSRFITQMEYSGFEIKHKIVNAKVEMNTSSLKVIEKTPEVMLKLNELAVKGISPSALATYMNNPIDFYHQKILGIKKISEVEETVAANTMGTIIHDTLEQLYLPFVGKFVQIQDLKNMLSTYEVEIESQFKKTFFNGETSTGMNKLIYEISKQYVKRFLNQEKAFLTQGNEVKILSLEEKLSAVIDVAGIDVPVKIHGTVDRVDEVNGVLRILDYKTGKVLAHELRVDNFEHVADDYKYAKALQVMIYTYLFSQKNNIDFKNEIHAGIISFKNLKAGFLKMNFAAPRKSAINEITNDRMDEFLIELRRILSEIFDLNIPFTENENKKF